MRSETGTDHFACSKRAKFERRVARQCGLTVAGLRTLAKAVAGRPIAGTGAGHGTASAIPRLVRNGDLEIIPEDYYWPEYKLFPAYKPTTKGLDAIQKARDLGW